MNAADAWKDDWARALAFIHEADEWKAQRDEARLIAEDILQCVKDGDGNA